MLKALQRFLSILLLLLGALYLGYQLLLYEWSQALYPPQTVVAGVDVSRMSRPEADETVQAVYAAPVTVHHQEEQLPLNPEDVGFVLDIERMLDEAEAANEQDDYWRGYVEFVLGRRLNPVTVALQATHDRDALVQWLETMASFLDEPAKPPQLLLQTADFQEGEDGFVTDIQASVPVVESLLYQPDNREGALIIEMQTAPDLSMRYLEENILRLMEGFDGFGSVFVMDLQTGEEISINGDVALSGLSVLKIAIFVEAYRKLSLPLDAYYVQLFSDTAVASSNYAANLLLHVVAGENNTYLGADKLTESMQRLGLVNTFMAVPYDAVAPATRPNTYVTLANARTDISVRPDPAMQTTAEDMGTLLAMIYRCAKGGGALLAVYGNELTPEECQAIIDVLVLNEEGNIIRFGVPEATPVSHKHGWNLTDHSDGGIVYSPNGDYVLYIYLSKPGSDWLSSEISFPIMREISRAVYNYFNFEEPNLEDPEERAFREALAREAAAEQAALEATALISNTDTISETSVSP